MRAAQPLMGAAAQLPRSLAANLLRLRRGAIATQPKHGTLAKSVSLPQSARPHVKAEMQAAGQPESTCETSQQRLVNCKAAAADSGVLILAVRCQELPEGQQHCQKGGRPQQKVQGAGTRHRGRQRQ